MFASIKYEQLPYFCNHCGIIGHSIDSCRVVNNFKGEEERVQHKAPSKSHKRNVEGEWFRKGETQNEEPPLVQNQDVELANGFAVLDGLDKEEEVNLAN